MFELLPHGFRTHGRLSELQSALMSWYDLQERSRELEHCLDAEQQQVRALELSHDLLTLNSVADLEAARDDLTVSGTHQ